MSAQAIYRLPDVIRLTGIGRTTIWRLEKAGTFPTRRLISTRSVGWFSAEIDAWIASRAPAGPQDSTATARVAP